MTEPSPSLADPGRPAITITYCRQCNWMLRAAWMAQELLSTFSEDLGSVTLVPGTGGVLEIRCDGALLWERKADGGFPEAKVLKQRLRDLVWPERPLGHADRTQTSAEQPPAKADRPEDAVDGGKKS